MYNYIKILEENNFENESIIVIQKFVNYFFEKKDIELAGKKINTIFKIFELCNITTEQIEKILTLNVRLLLKSDKDIIKIAYVWNLVNDFDKAGKININKLNRTFLRYSYLNSNIRYKVSNISYEAMRMSDEKFEKQYIGTIDGKIFNPNYENLVFIYGQGSNFDEKEQFIDEFISKNAISWYTQNTLKSRKKR
ncbi:MAG: hypothetical protein RSB54_00515 [Bacilli bacterium]